MTPTVQLNGVRLFDEGHVREISARVFYVQGDGSSTYTVILPAEHRPSCSCPARGVCKHMAAAATLIVDERNQKEAGLAGNETGLETSGGSRYARRAS